MNRTVSSLCLILFATLLSANARGAGVDNAASEQKRAAQKMFEAADGLYESGRFDEAAQAFRASYALVASPNSRLMIARSLRELQRYDEAYTEYQGTIRDAEASGGRYPESLNAARAEADALKAHLAYLVIDSSPEDAAVELRVNGKAVKWTASERIAVIASKVEVEFRYANGQTRRQSLDLKASETRRLVPIAGPTPVPKTSPPTQSMSQAPRPRQESHSNGLRTSAYVAGGVGAAGLVTFGIFGVLDRSIYSDLHSKCNSNACPPAKGNDIDAGRRYQLIANIGLGVAAVGVATAVTFYLVSSSGQTKESSVSLRLGPGNVVVAGEF